MFNSLLNSSITGRTCFKIAVAEVFFLPLPNTEREVRTAAYPHGSCAIAVVVVVDTTTTAIANRPFAWTSLFLTLILTLTLTLTLTLNTIPNPYFTFVHLISD